MPVRAGDPCTKGAPQVPRPKGRQSPRAPLSRGAERRHARHRWGGKEPMTALLRAKLSWRLDGAASTRHTGPLFTRVRAVPHAKRRRSRATPITPSGRRGRALRAFVMTRQEIPSPSLMRPADKSAARSSNPPRVTPQSWRPDGASENDPIFASPRGGRLSERADNGDHSSSEEPVLQGETSGKRQPESFLIRLVPKH